jgi:carbon monoxide dehydrogenase subunit G
MEQSFEVAAPIDEVWKALIDPARVAPCLPGASITEMDPDGSYKGTFEVKLGPTTASYRGSLKIEEADEATHRAVLSARGTDKRGQGGASATIVNTLTESGAGTRVHADTDFNITGRLARFGRGGMIEDISNRLLREFAACLQSQLASPAAAGEAATPQAEAAAAAEGTASGDSPASGTAPSTAGVPPRPPAPSPPPPQPAAKPISGFSLVLGVLYRRVARFFNRPGRGG